MKRWLKTYNSASPEEFVEHIPFQETKDYVKRVYRSYQIYLQIYSS
jgi:soluble lytic murein transglycosylase